MFPECNKLPPNSSSNHKTSVVFDVASREAASFSQLVEGVVDKISAGLNEVLAEMLSSGSPGIPPYSTTKPVAVY